MAASRQDIIDWFAEGVASDCTHMIVVCDTFDYDDYPVFVFANEDVHKVYEKYNGNNMQKVMEVYDLSMDRDPQLAEFRAFNF